MSLAEVPNVVIRNLQGHNSEARGLKHPRNRKPDDNYYKLSNMRVIQKKLVYVIGLSTQLALTEVDLASFEYFGQYGRITKLVVNKNKIYNANGPNGPSYSAYITYSTPEESSIAILSLDNALIDNHTIRASYGTTKYCSNFLRGNECLNKECLYLHAFADENDNLDKNDMNVNKSIFLSQHILAMKIANIFDSEVKAKINQTNHCKTIFPAPFTLYEKEIVLQRMQKMDENLNSIDSFEIDLSPCKSPLYKQKETSRFNFVSMNLQEEPIEIPKFVTYLISKNFSRFSSFRSFTKSSDDLSFYDRALIKPYADGNNWAKSIISICNNEKIRINIDRLSEKSDQKCLRKFNSA